MLDIAVQAEPAWPAADWDGAAARAVTAAIRNSPFVALADADFSVEVAVRLTDDDEVRTLNAQYRGKDKPTNVLSFPMVEPDMLATLANTDDGEVLLGDIVLAHGVCAAEAAARGVDIDAHAIHLIVHGTYHLLGYDHQGTEEAGAMEAMERETMAKLGLHDPYDDTDEGG
ncbi:rRNA maturation RNase YbeY [Sphingomonas flavalba]|uniref:rRNA maturation RNase YbeY n=1 Tax=Sphingomonas flavalba TaxID=2559804 RepID=UPI00109D83DE|nr:rRNA maturation RNase YbeY [Sphingomonas flavalba]